MLTHANTRRKATASQQAQQFASIGRNPVIQQLLGSVRVQPKLRVGAVNDPAEAEADRVADHVMRMPQPAGVEVRRKCAGCEEEAQRRPVEIVHRMEDELQLKPAPGRPNSAGAEAAAAAVSGSGVPLPADVQSYFEPRFGCDFSDVRIHTGLNAATAAKSINARAYTLGRNIAFGASQYAPGSVDGKRLIAHELAHTVQQSPVAARKAADNHSEVKRSSIFASATSQSAVGELMFPRVSPPLIQRNCSDDEAFHQAAPNFCRDDTWSPITHSGKTCYREITNSSGFFDCPSGEHVCFNAKGECEASPDRSSLAEAKQADGSCSWREYCVLEHIAVDVVPAVLSDHFERIGRQQIECLKSCRELPWYLRGFCLQGCSGSAMTR